MAQGLAIVAGFSVVVIAVHPWGGARQADWFGFAACMVCVACFSVNMVWSRVLTRTERPESLRSSRAGHRGGGFGADALPCGTADLLQFAATIRDGLFCALGTLCFYIAVKHTSAANVSQYHYTQLITGTLISYLVWHDKPGLFVLAARRSFSRQGCISPSLRELPFR